MDRIKEYLLIWSLCFIVSSSGEESIQCQKVDVSGIKYQLSRKGSYSILSSSRWCQTTHPSYQQDDGTNYLFFLEASSGWKGWIIGSSLCQNLAGVVVDYESATDPTKIPSNVYWYELYNGNWIRNTGLNVGCDDSALSTWEIIGIVVAVLVLVVVVVVLVLCCIHKSSNKPASPQSAAIRRRHVQVSPCGNTQLYCNPEYNNGRMRPTVWSTNPINDVRYIPPPEPNAHYSSMNNNRNTTTTGFGPPPSYQDSLTHATNAPAQQNSGVTPCETAQRNDVIPNAPPMYTASGDDRPVFSPPPQYSA